MKRKKEKGKSGARVRAGTLFAFCLLTFSFAAGGCTRDFRFQPLSMWNESRLKPMEGSPMPGQGGVSFAPPPGTVARGQLASYDPVNTGRSGGRLLTTSPIPVTKEMLVRGQERYNVYCAPCHSRVGNGQGMIVKRSFPEPPDYAIRRLRDAPIGHFYDVITNGYGVMYSYAERVPVQDRWAIAAYIRVLQNVRKDVPEEQGVEARMRAREAGVRDPHRPMRTGPPENQPGIVNPAEQPHTQDGSQGGTEVPDRMRPEGHRGN